MSIVNITLLVDEIPVRLRLKGRRADLFLKRHEEIRRGCMHFSHAAFLDQIIDYYFADDCLAKIEPLAQPLSAVRLPELQVAPRSRILTDKDRARIIMLRRAGVSAEVLGRRFGRTPQMIRRIILAMDEQEN